jgi:hypothetical protein
MDNDDDMIDGELLMESIRESVWKNVIAVVVSCESRGMITIVTCILAFLPLFMNLESNIDDSVLATSLRSGEQWYESSIVALTLVAPLAIDLSFDLLQGLRMTNEEREKRRRSKEKGDADTEQLTTIEKAIIIAGFAVLPAIACLPRSTANLSLIWLCCRRCQLICVINTFWSSWSRYDPKHWSPRLTTLCIVLFSAGNVLFPFIPIMASGAVGSLTSSASSAIHYQSVDTQAALVLYAILVLTPCLAMLWVTLRWICNKRTEFATSAGGPNTPDQDTSVKEPARDHEKDMILFPFIFVVSTFGLVVFTALVVGVYSDPHDLTPTGLMLTNLTMILFELVILNFLMRRTKFEAIANLYALIDAKKSYVR